MLRRSRDCGRYGQWTKISLSTSVGFIRFISHTYQIQYIQLTEQFFILDIYEIYKNRIWNKNFGGQ